MRSFPSSLDSYRTVTWSRRHRLTEARLPLALSLFAVGMIVRLLYIRAVVFPPLDDPAYYVQVARNLAAGRGLEIDVIWSFMPAFSSVTHPSNDFWMPLPSLVMWPFLAALGDNLLAAQLPGLLAGAALVPLTFLAGLSLLDKTLDRLPAFGISSAAGILIAVNPVLSYQSATVDSSAPYALLSALAVTLLWRRTPSLVWPLASGILIGLAYLTSSSGVFLVLAGGTWLAIATLRDKKPQPYTARLMPLAALLSGVALVVAPWLARNYWTFGFLTSPAGLQSILATDYAQLFTAGKSPGPYGPGDGGLGAILQLRAEALWTGYRQVLDFIFFPSCLPAVAGLVLLARRLPSFRLALGYLGALYLGLSLVFSVPAINGSFYHSVGGAVPFLSLGYVYLIWRLAAAVPVRRLALPAGLGMFGAVLLLAVSLQALTFPAVATRHQSEREVFGRASTWLKAHDATVVMAMQPATLNYASGIPSVMLPVSDPPEAVWQTARRYRATHLLATQKFGLYPEALEGDRGSMFELVYHDSALHIYEVRGASGGE